MEKAVDLERTKVCIILALVFGLKTSEIYLGTSQIIAALLDTAEFRLESLKSKKFLYLNENCLNLLLDFLNKVEVNWSFAFNTEQKDHLTVASLPRSKVIKQSLITLADMVRVPQPKRRAKYTENTESLPIGNKTYFDNLTIGMTFSVTLNLKEPHLICT